VSSAAGAPGVASGGAGASGGSTGALPRELFARPCPLCGSAQAREVAPANFDPSRLDRFAFSSRKLPEFMHLRLVECVACDLLYSSPAPARDALETAYDAAAFDAGTESSYAALTYASFLSGIGARLPDRNGALDIGTGDGAFLVELLRAGFENVAGVEPSSAPIAAADPGVRGLIRHGPFRPGDFAAAQFRLVTCFQTMEHVYDPLQLCRDAHAIIKPGGAFFIVCHNRRAMLARILGRRSPIYDIEHLQLFSPRSVRRLLERAGFHDVEVRLVVNRYPAAYWAKLLPLPGGLKRGLLDLLRHSGLGRRALPAPVGNLAAIAWR
jgi:SAM-dependent methyltransferase